LHGGPKGFDAEAFETLSGVDELALVSAAEKAVLKKNEANYSYGMFKHTSPDGDQGFPGELLIETLVGVGSLTTAKVAGPEDELDLGSVLIVYRAKVTSKTGEKVVTPINITQVFYGT
jgi:aldose 1-epimerase